MSESHPWRDKGWLMDEYVRKEQTTAEIAEHCGCCSSTIENWLDKYDIETRGPNRKPADERLLDPDWLRKQYVGKSRVMADIADECGCAHGTIGKWLDRHGIDKRRTGPQVQYLQLADKDWLHKQYIEREKCVVKIANECGCGKTTVVKWLDEHNIETRTNTPDPPDERLTDPEWIRERYVERKWSTKDIAKECNCSDSTAFRWVKKHGVDTRTGPPTGEDHPNWQGGTREYGPGWNRGKRRAVRERDGYSCCDPNCSVTQEQHIQEYDEKLHVHHLRKARHVDDPTERNSKENLITLCRPCHWNWERISKTGLVPQVVSD